MRLLLFSLASIPIIAYAQEKPPVLERFIQAEYPASALAAGVEGEVIFSLTIEVDGALSEVRVTEPAGFGFTEAALTAIKGFVFTPATKDGVPVRAQILYKYRFSLATKNKQATPFFAPLDIGEGEPLASDFSETEFIEILPPGALTGAILERGTRDPIPYALIAVINKDKVLREINADENRRFTLLGIVPGSAQIKVIASGYESLFSLETIPEAGMLSVDFRLLPETTTGYGLVVCGEELNQEVTRRVLSPEELEMIPGSRGDVLKAVQNLPGLARTFLGLGGLVVRGSSPEDTQVFLDGMPMPLLYHFGGLTSVISEDFISGITFLPGVFSARYGRGMGGVIEVETKLSEPPRLQGSIDTDILDTGLMIKGKLPIEGMRYAVAARRSYIDLPLSVVQAVGIDLGLTIFPHSLRGLAYRSCQCLVWKGSFSD
jgi:TonB family protein